MPPKRHSKGKSLKGYLGVARLIEQEIGVGNLAPGSWLKQVDLQHRYGCTRFDVRQALDDLVTKGLVRNVANRGYHVSEIDAQRVKNLLRIRAVLEVEAAEDVMRNITPMALT